MPASMLSPWFQDDLVRGLASGLCMTVYNPVECRLAICPAHTMALYCSQVPPIQRMTCHAV